LIERLLHSRGTPTRSEIQALVNRVQELSRELEAVRAALPKRKRGKTKD